MKYKVEQEVELLADVISFANDPLAFVLYAYPWGVEGTPLAKIKGPRTWQREVLEEIRDHTQKQEFNFENDWEDLLEVFQEAIASGRGIGKSALFGWIAHWHVSCHIGASVVVTANTESQLRNKTFPEFGRWVGMAINSHWFEIDSMKIYPRDWISKIVNDQLKINPMYWTISGINWSEENPDAFAGTHNAYGLMVLYDESSGIPAAIWDVTEGFFTELNAYRYWLAFSNPRRNAGAYYDRFHKAAYKKYWLTKQIDARTVGGTDQRIYQKIIDTKGADSDEARVEVYGQFPESSEDQFISNLVVRAAQNRVIDVFDDTEPLIMGVDPAPRGRTAIRFRQGRDARSIPPTILNGKDNNEIADTIVRLINKYDPDGIAVDAGMGTGVIDNLKKRKVKVFEVWMGTAAENKEGEFATLGTELWGALRDWLPGGCIDAEDKSQYKLNSGKDDDPALRLFNDLTARTWKYFGREDGKKILTSKKDMAKDGIPSPDDGDALALTFYPKVPRRMKRVAGRSVASQPKIAAGVGECEI